MAITKLNRLGGLLPFFQCAKNTVRYLKINTFISLSALVVISLFVAVSIFVSNFIILNGIDSIENDQAIEDALKLKNYINHCEKELDKLTMDWAYWDDTYSYLRTRDKEFLATNFEYSIFEQQQISAAAIFDLQNNFVFGAKAVSEQALTQDLSPSDISSLSQITALLNDNDGLSGIEGVVQLDGSPHIFAMRKITDTQMHKNSNGVLVLIKLIDVDFITNIEDNLLFTVTALTPHQIDNELINTTVVDIFRIKKFPDSISVYVPIFDAFGDVALGLKLNINRTVMQFGKRIFSNSLHCCPAKG